MRSTNLVNPRDSSIVGLYLIVYATSRMDEEGRDPKVQQPQVILPSNPPTSVQPLVSNTPSYASDSQAALKAVHSAGLWAIILGLLNIVWTPLMQALEYTPANAAGHSEATLVMASLLIGLLIGGVFIGLGIKLRTTVAERIHNANRTLLYLGVTIAAIAILSLIGGGHGAGLLNLLALIVVGEARTKIRKLPS